MKELLYTLVLGLIVVIALSLAKAKGYFKIEEREKQPFISGLLVAIVFGIYISTSFLFPSLLVSLLHNHIANSVALISIINSLVLLTILFLLLLCCINLKREILRSIFKRQKTTIISDIVIGIIFLLIAFPSTLFCSQILDMFSFLLFKVTEIPDQFAVEFLKKTVGFPLFFSMALISMVLLAPAIEELLFRGFLQNWIKTFVNKKFAIAIVAALFALFHFTPAQGIGNITIIGSLFVFSIFLGLVYERQKSLISAITLHASFNLINIINVLIFKVK